MTTRHRKNEYTNNYGPIVGSRRFYSIRQAAWTLGISSDEMARAVRVGTVRTIRRRGALMVSAEELTRHLTPPIPVTTSVEFSPADATEGTLDALDRYQDVPTEALARIVVRDCAAPLDDLDAESDAQLAERICGACRSPLACVELELRLHGAETVGVWGGLPGDAVRALRRGWLDRRGYAAPGPMCVRCDHSEWVHEAFCMNHVYIPPALDADTLESDRDEDREEWA